MPTKTKFYFRPKTKESRKWPNSPFSAQKKTGFGRLLVWWLDLSDPDPLRFYDRYTPLLRIFIRIHWQLVDLSAKFAQLLPFCTCKIPLIILRQALWSGHYHIPDGEDVEYSFIPSNRQLCYTFSSYCESSSHCQRLYASLGLGLGSLITKESSVCSALRISRGPGVPGH